MLRVYLDLPGTHGKRSQVVEEIWNVCREFGPTASLPSVAPELNAEQVLVTEAPIIGADWNRRGGSTIVINVEDKRSVAVVLGGLIKLLRLQLRIVQ